MSADTGTWADVLLAALWALVWIYALGLLIVSLFRGSWGSRLAFAPAVSVGVIAWGAVLQDKLAIPWGPQSVFVYMLLCLLIWGVRLCAAALARRPRLWRLRRKNVSESLVTIGIWAIPAIASAISYMYAKSDPNGLSQTYDGVFHMNLVRYIIENQDGSSLKSGYMDGSADPNGFYPSAWHDLAALVVSQSGVSIPVATSALDIVLLAVVWPISVSYLSAKLFSRLPLVRRSALVLAGLFSAFPWFFLGWGVLSSNTLSLSLYPVVLACAVLVVDRIRAGDGLWALLQDRTVYVVLFGMGVLALAQPNSIFNGVVALTPAVAFAVFARLARKHGRGWIASIGGVAVVLAVAAGWAVVYNLPAMARTVGWSWDSPSSLPDAILPALALGLNGAPMQLLATVLSAWGAWLVWRRHSDRRWLLVAVVFVMLQYLLAYATEGWAKQVLTGFWYHDSVRFTGAITILLVPLAALGLADVTSRLARRMHAAARGAVAVRFVAFTVAIAVPAVYVLSPSGFAARKQIYENYNAYALISPEERDFLGKVSAEVGSSVILNDPYDGSAFAYALFGTDTVFKSMEPNWMGTWDKNKETMIANIADRTDEECALLEEYGVSYLLSLGTGTFQSVGSYGVWPQISDPHNWGSAVDLVLQDGDMVLARVVGCEATASS